MYLRWDFTAFSNICLKKNEYMLISISRGTHLRRHVVAKITLDFWFLFALQKLADWVYRHDRNSSHTAVAFLLIKLFNNFQFLDAYVRKLTLGYKQTRVITQCGSRTRTINRWPTSDFRGTIGNFFIFTAWVDIFLLNEIIGVEETNSTQMNKWQLNKI